MLLKVAIIVLIIYIIVVTRSRIRLPNPALQATVDVLQAATLKDEHVMQMARKYIDYADAQNALLPIDDPYAERLDRLTSRYVAVNGVPLNFRVYKTAQINAFATADGSIRIFSGLMDLMNDDELMAIVGHEMGHIRNSDTLSAMRKAYLTSAARNALGATGGVIGSLSSSQWGSLAEKLAGIELSIPMQATDDEQLFGSVTARMVADQLAVQGFSIDHNRVKMDPIKTLGTFDVEVKLHKDVDATLKVWVVRG